MGFTVSFYVGGAGRAPVLESLKDLAADDRARILERLKQIEERGFHVVGVQFRQIEGKLWEMKLGPWRILYAVLVDDELIVLHLYRKRGRKMPLHEKAVALKRLKEINQ